MIKTITETWGGFLIEFPSVRGNDSTYIYKRNNKTHAIICFTEFDEDYKKTLDVIISEQSFKDLLVMADLFDVSIVLAAKYNDKQVFASIEDFYVKRQQFLHDNNAFLPKEHFKILKRGK